MPSSFFRTPARPYFHFAFACCLTLCYANMACAEEVSEGEAKTEVVFEIDPYYSDVGLNVPLTTKPIPTIESRSEAVIYRELIKGSLIPRYMLLEASVYPMPVLGTHLKQHSPEFFDRGRINDNINIIESLTAGFQEPWAVSAFFGNVAKLKRPGDTRQGNDYGYTGYLFSAGAKHIKNNVMIDDEWCELEWKIKGKLDYTDEKLAWSFRIGGKYNRNRDVNNVTYIALHRSNTDIRSTFLAWLENTNYDFRVHFLQQGGKPVRAELIAGKKLPLPDYGYSPTLSIGLIWASPDEYSGLLRDANSNKLTLVIRPSLEF